MDKHKLDKITQDCTGHSPAPASELPQTNHDQALKGLGNDAILACYAPVNHRFEK